MRSNRLLSATLVGGAGGAFFAHAHEKAVHQSGQVHIGSGVLSSDPGRGRAAAENWPYPIAGYGTIGELLAAVRKDPEKKPDMAIIVTPNHAHYAQASAFIRAGIPVVLEKPVTMTLRQALSLKALAKKHNVPVAVAHTYLGHWTTWLSAHIVRKLGLLGDVRKVISNYWQGWLDEPIEQGDNPQQQAGWRTNPKLAGKSGCGGDIGTHAFAQARYVTGLGFSSVDFARAKIWVPNRQLDDDFFAHCTLENGATAQIAATQIAIGHKNDLRLEVNGTKGTLIWHQEASERLTLHLKDTGEINYYRGAIADDDRILGVLPHGLKSRILLPGGHAEGFHDALGNIHRNFAAHVRSWQENPVANPVSFHFDEHFYPTLTEGVEHMAFLQAALSSARQRRKVAFPKL